jgi:iron complex transport system permease protein
LERKRIDETWIEKPMGVTTLNKIVRRPKSDNVVDAHALARHRSREVLVISAMAITLGVVFLTSLALGSVWIPIEEIVGILKGSELVRRTSYVVVHDVRLPRSLTALLSGAALGIAGLQMQTIFRNPLADPFVLGISSGASLGVALVVLGSGATASAVFGSNLGLAGDAVIIAAAIIGSSLMLGIVLTVSNRIASPPTVLVLGLMFGYASSAFVTVMVAGTDPEQLQRWVAWGFGSFSGVTWSRLNIFWPLIAAGFVVAIGTTKQLNALLLGENYAKSMGLAVKRTRVITMLGASVLGGVVTAFCGPISFLGIAIPHICRALLGTSDHRALVPAVVLTGGTVALLAQILALLPGNAGVLPLNAVTSLLGAPIVVAVLLRNRRGVFTA